MDQNQIPQQGSKMSVLSLVSMIIGIISVPMICCSFFDLPLSIAAIICGHLGVKDAANNGKTGGGMGKAGLILGYISLVLTIAFIVFALVSDSGEGPKGFEDIMKQIEAMQGGAEPTIEITPDAEVVVPEVQ